MMLATVADTYRAAVAEHLVPVSAFAGNLAFAAGGVNYFHAGENPLLLWMASNAVVQRDGKDNIYPVKKRSRGRIDGIIAAIMARKLAALGEEPPKAYQMLVLGGAR